MNSAFGVRIMKCLPGFLLLFLALTLLAAPAQAQPFNTWLHLVGKPTHGYIAIPHSPALNPTGGFTFEAWVNVTDPGGGCSSIAGKNWHKAWWIGICGTTLRSYIRGYSGSGEGPGTFRDAGALPPNLWTHLAVVFNGTTRFHYINGELAGSWPEPSPLTTDTDEMRIGSDVQFQVTPAGNIDEVHLWNVGRTQTQVRADMSAPITSALPGLVSVWHLDGTTLDSIGGHSGTVSGAGVSGGSFATTSSCGSSTVAALCLQSRFQITTKRRVAATPGGAPDGNGSVVVAGPNSGIFWFFSSDNWEVMVKALNGCGLNSRYWIYSAATTNVFYRMDVLDVTRGVQKIYFNYPGPPAPAVTDSDAFATCP